MAVDFDGLRAVRGLCERVGYVVLFVLLSLLVGCVVLGLLFIMGLLIRGIISVGGGLLGLGCFAF